MNPKKSNNKGLTLTELMISSIVSVIILASVLNAWHYSYKNWARDRLKSKLYIDLQVAIEKIKNETRLSSASYMGFYPEGATEYQAISIPAATGDANGLFTLDTDDKIYWDKSIIYHVYDNELRRTEFTDNHDILANSDSSDPLGRYAQLASVVADGDGSSAVKGTNGTTSTKTIAKNLKSLAITPNVQLFDGYSASLARSDNVEFGSILLSPGNHDFKFEVVGQNTASTSYKLGIDTLSISPSGGAREAETYTPVASSGDSYSVVYAEGWCGNQYLEYAADGAGEGGSADYVTLELYYDMWRESNFEQTANDNIMRDADTDKGFYVRLATPKEGKRAAWQASMQTGSAGENLLVALPGGTDVNMSIRNLLKGTRILQSGNLARVKFVAASTGVFTINEAYITKWLNGAKAVPGSTVQLFFSDAQFENGTSEPAGGGSAIGGAVGTDPVSVTLQPGNCIWSNWAQIDTDSANDYFVTFSTPKPCANVIYWEGATPGDTNSFVSEDAYSASQENWSSPMKYTAHDHIYAVESIENWPNYGTATSGIYDTKLDNPVYGDASWDAYKPSGTDISLKARSSDDPNMAGATGWDSISGSSANPHSIASIGTGRHVQFQATLSTSSPYSEYPWIDDVSIDWPGAEKMCDISGYFTKKPDYGIIKLTVDDQELIKSMGFTVSVSENLQGKEYEASLKVEIDPRNTGK